MVIPYLATGFCVLNHNHQIRTNSAENFLIIECDLQINKCYDNDIDRNFECSRFNAS